MLVQSFIKSVWFEVDCNPKALPLSGPSELYTCDADWLDRWIMPKSCSIGSKIGLRQERASLRFPRLQSPTLSTCLARQVC